MIGTKIATILSKIEQATLKFAIKHPVRLVAVSKTKTVEEIREAYDVGLRNFGENYVDEIELKQPKVRMEPPSCRKISNGILSATCSPTKSRRSWYPI